jgi:N-acetylmuramoyl-L-alanine amidase
MALLQKAYLGATPLFKEKSWFEDMSQVPINDSGDITVTADTAAHTKGAWVELVASTSANASFLIVEVVGLFSAGTDTATLVDIGTGASGAESRESAITLAAALDLKRELESTGRYRVRLTRDSDSYVALYRRVAIARQADADLFISLHADAGADPATRGASVYTLSEQGAGRAVREFTRSENWHRSLNLPGRDPSVDRILLDMTQRATQNRSAQLARTLLGELEGVDHPMLRRSHRDAGLAVLLAPDVPAVLLEMGFITNPEDERLLNDSRARRRLMRAVADGIDRYFREPSGTLQMASVGGAQGQP